MTEAQQLLQQLIDKVGSLRAAAEVVGVAERNVQNWAYGYYTPRERNVRSMLIALQGDTLEARERRIIHYSRRAERQQPLFERSM